MLIQDFEWEWINPILMWIEILFRISLGLPSPLGMVYWPTISGQYGIYGAKIDGSNTEWIKTATGTYTSSDAKQMNQAQSVKWNFV